MLPTLQAMRVLPPALLQVTMIVMIMMMMIRTNLLAVMILYKISHCPYVGMYFLHVFCRHCPMMCLLSMYIMYHLLVGLDMSVLYCLTGGFDV